MRVMLNGLFGEPGGAVGASASGAQVDAAVPAPRNCSLMGRELKKYSHQPPNSASSA